MGLLDRKNTQTTASVRMSLQPELLRYAELLNRTPSTLVNDILEGAFFAVRAEEPARALLVLDLLRQALGKDAFRKLGSEYYRKLAGTERMETERAVRFAVGNTSRFVPLLKAAKRQSQAYGDVRRQLFGYVESDLSEEIGKLYDAEVTALAAREAQDPVKVAPEDFFSAMIHTTALYNQTYNIFLKDHLAREVVKEIPREFMPI